MKRYCEDCEAEQELTDLCTCPFCGKLFIEKIDKSVTRRKGD
jgi:hypothetical protein